VLFLHWLPGWQRTAAALPLKAGTVWSEPGAIVFSHAIPPMFVVFSINVCHKPADGVSINHVFQRTES
jgi:hypothetical protein